MSRMPARLRPAYQEEIWVVRGKFDRRLLKNCEATKASKPKRISRNTARLLPISQVTNTTGGDEGFPTASKIVKRRTHTTAAAHSLRSKARSRNRTNRNISETKSAPNKPLDIAAMIVRAPRNCHCGPSYGCTDRKSTRLNSSHLGISYAVFC